MGRNHARLYRTIEGVRLVGITDPNPQVAELVGTRENVPHYTDYVTLLDEQKPDLVSIAAPTSMHYEIGTHVIDRGVHALMEKPITSTVEQGEALVELAKRKGVILAVGHVERFNPAVMELRRRLSEGMAGRIYKIAAQRLSPYPTRISDAGVVIDLASHDIDLMRHLMPETIVRIYGETLSSINSDREDLFNGLIRFASGAIGGLDINWMTPTKVRRLTVTGARGFLECNLLSQELFFFENDNAPSQWDTLSVLRGVSEGNTLGIRIQRHEPLAAELSDFVVAVRDGHLPMVTGEDGLDTLHLALQFVRSGVDGSPVVMPEKRQ